VDSWYNLCEDVWWCIYVRQLCVDWLWMLSVIVYMSSGGELLSIAYILIVGDDEVFESYVHAFMTDGGGFYIQLRWLWCFCCIMGDDLEEIWYHMHIWVELGAYHIAWVLMVVCEWWMLMISVLVNYMLAMIGVIKWLYLWGLMFLMIKWELNWFIYVKLFILIMIDVILTFSGFDRLPVCMDG
jgi:hypothetical protein